MAEIKAKMIRTVCPAGVSINFVGMCGDSHFPFPVSITLIKTMIERGVLVYEQISAQEEGEEPTELLLTMENYDQDNGGEEIPEGANIVPDIELEVKTRHDQERQDFLTNKGLEIKERQEKQAGIFLGILEPDSPTVIDFDVKPEDQEPSGGTSTPTLSPATDTPTITGSDDPTITGSGDYTITGSGDPFVEDPDLEN